MPPSCRKKSRWNLHWNTLENYKSLLKPDRCRHTDHHQRVSLFTSAIPRTTQPTIQNHLRRHLPSSTSTTLYSTLLYEPNSTHPTLLNPTLLNYSNPSSGIQSPVCDKVDALTAQSVQPQGSHLPKVGGWTQDTDPPWNRGVLVKKKKKKNIKSIYFRVNRSFSI